MRGLTIALLFAGFLCACASKDEHPLTPLERGDLIRQVQVDHLKQQVGGDQRPQCWASTDSTRVKARDRKSGQANGSDSFDSQGCPPGADLPKSP